MYAYTFQRYNAKSDFQTERLEFARVRVWVYDKRKRVVGGDDYNSRAFLRPAYIYAHSVFKNHLKTTENFSFQHNIMNVKIKRCVFFIYFLFLF